MISRACGNPDNYLHLNTLCMLGSFYALYLSADFFQNLL